MGEVVKIEVPLPSALTTTPEGVVAEGQAYSVRMPVVATDAMVITSQGKSISNKPTELVFTGKDANGTRRWDYIVGSAPSSVTTRDYEARYKRLYPNADDVLLPKEESVKHLTILNERVRLPADYLVSEVEFGVSSLVSGVMLPVGFHDEITADGFTLPRPVAHDAELRKCFGRYEVVGGDCEQTLYVWFDAEWFANSTYPVTIDPTVGTSTRNTVTTNPYQRKVARCSLNGVLYCVFTDGSNTVLKYSADNGATWQTPSSGGTIATNTNTSGGGMVFIDPDDSTDSVHVVFQGKYHFGTPTANRTGITWSTPLTIGGLDTMTVTAHREGTGWMAHVLWTDSNVETDSGTLNYRRVSVASDGTPSLVGSNVSLATNVTTTSPKGFIVHDSAKNLYVGLTHVFAGAGAQEGVRVRVAPYPAWTFGTSVQLNTNEYGNPIGAGVLDDDGNLYIPYQANSTNYLRLYKRTSNGSITNVSPTNVVVSRPTLAIDRNTGKIYVFYVSSGIKYRIYDPSSGTPWGTEQTLNATATADYPSTKPDGAGSGIDVVCRTGSGSPYTVESNRISLNVAPSAPTITLASVVFAAPVGTDLTITHNDTDQMGAWALYYDLNGTKRWWDNAAKTFSKTVEYFNTGSGFSVTIAAADLANKLTTGNVYQFYAATKDSQGAVGDYNSTAVLANVGATPNPTITSGATSNSPKYNAEWTVDQSQGAYKLRVLDGATEVSTTGKVTGADVRLYTVDLPDNGTAYTVELTVWDQTAGGGVASTPVTKEVTTSFTPVATPTLEVNPLSGDGYIGVVWESPTPVDQPTCSYVDLYRDGVRIATQLPASGSYPDYNVASNVTHSYYVKAVGENETTSVSETLSGNVTFTNGLWLHDTVDPQSTCHWFNYRDNELQETRKPASAEFRLAGRSGPLVQFNKSMQDRNISLKVYLDKTTNDKDALLALYNAAGALCLRDGRGRKVFGVIRELPTTDQLWGTVVDLNFFGVSYVESL